MVAKGSPPFSVTIVIAVILFSGVLAVGSGIWRLFNREDNIGWIAASFTILIGVIYLLVAKGIANGSRGARFLVALITVLMIATSVLALVVSPSLWIALSVQILLGLIVLGLLYNAKARQFFAA